MLLISIGGNGSILEVMKTKGCLLTDVKLLDRAPQMTMTMNRTRLHLAAKKACLMSQKKETLSKEPTEVVLLGKHHSGLHG